MKNVAVISLGSNCSSPADRINAALKRLHTMTTQCSALYHDNQLPPYLNCVARLTTDFTYEELRMLFKEMEQAAGRTQLSKQQGLIPLDIDIVIFNGEIKRPHDYTAPYFQQGYSQLHKF